MTRPDLIELEDIRVRPAEDGDIGYVIQTWGHTLRGEYPDARTTDFVDQLRQAIEQRLKSGARILVAYPAEHRDVIHGWLCYNDRDGVVHYVYVRDGHRRCGIARRMIEETGLSMPLHVDTMTGCVRAIKRTHPEQIRYLPNV